MTQNDITIYHSPDSDDAFMFYGLTTGAVSYPGYNFKHALKDIESLNQLTRKGEIDTTAVSVHAYAYLANNYTILRSGASMGGEKYGPKLVVRNDVAFDINSNPTIAIPGELTSATLATKLFLHEQGINATLKNYFFDDVQKVVKSGEVQAGVIIHEGQLTHGKEGLTTALDLGEWWWRKTGLPLPLGINVARTSMGPDAIKAVSTVLKDTIQYSLDHRKEALEYALTYGRGLSYEDADVFVGMYVNERTVNIGDDGLRSIDLFLSLAYEAGILPNRVSLKVA